jgi:hypothetical protein
MASASSSVSESSGLESRSRWSHRIYAAQLLHLFGLGTLILAVLVMGLTALVTRNAFAYPAGCFHPIRTKECGTFELLLLYAAALATFSAITRNRGTNPSGPAGLGGQKSPLPCSVEIGVVFTAEVLRAGIGLLGLTFAGHSLILRRCGH